MRGRTTAARWSAIIALTALLLGGCAVFDSDNRRTLNALDEHLAPDSQAVRWVLAPIAFPAGFVAAALDIVIVHPATVFDDAWFDTVDLLWTSRNESRFRRALLVPLAALATPFVYLGDWLGRSLFAIPPRKDRA